MLQLDDNADAFGLNRQPLFGPLGLDYTMSYDYSKLYTPQGFFTPSEYAMFFRPLGPDYRYPALVDLFKRERPSFEYFTRELNPFAYDGYLRALSKTKLDETSPYWDNGYFSGDDARSAYAFAARFKPRRILELGCGNSTKFFRAAIRNYALETELISVDPQPRVYIESIVDRIIRKPIHEVDLAIFSELQAGDILFYDGSHLCVNGSDVTRFFLEILPLIPAGVYVHVHDIVLPNEYPPVFTQRMYNEQYVLAVLLLFSPLWRPILPCAYLVSEGLLREGGVSFWMIKHA